MKLVVFEHHCLLWGQGHGRHTTKAAGETSNWCSRDHNRRLDAIERVMGVMRAEGMFDDCPRYHHFPYGVPFAFPFSWPRSGSYSGTSSDLRLILQLRRL